MTFLGDCIYESGSTGPVRSHQSGRIESLAGHRHRYGLYEGDANLQSAHLGCPWLVTWDDHEVANDYAGPDFDEHGTPPQLPFLELRAAAYQAWYEHQPVRQLQPKGPDYRIYRSFDFGDLARIPILDPRPHRSDQPCGGLLGPPCAGFPDPGGQALGPAQEAWLFDTLAASGADAADLTGPIASEFVATGISSAGFPEALVDLVRDLLQALPHAPYFEPVPRGSLRHVVTRDEWRADFRYTSTVTEPTATVSTGKSFVVEDGNPVPQEARVARCGYGKRARSHSTVSSRAGRRCPSR